ncbi:hypothetical protein Tco_0454265 [Tanacetum coccineum]
MDSLDKTATNRVNLLKAFNGVTETLKVVQDAVKDDPVLNKKVIEATEAYTKNSSSLTELLSLANKCRRENDTHADIKEPPSHTEGEHVAIEDDKAEEEPTRAVALIESLSRPLLNDPILEIHRQHTKKVKRLTELNKKRAEQYMWTMSNKLKPKPITDVKIHPNSKPTVLTVYRNNDKRNFDVHNPFKFGDFKITKLDELGPIIEKKKNSIVKDLMTSLGKRYERLKKIPEELGIQSDLPAPILEQASSQSLVRKRKHMELEPEIKVPGLECNRRLPEGVPFVNSMVIEEPEYGIFFTDVFGDQAFQRWNDIHKVVVDSLVSYLVMASTIKTLENARFWLKLKKLIVEHPDQEKVQSKKVKLEVVRYLLD